MAALSAKAVFKPAKDFHTARHMLFTAEQNLAIDSRERGAFETDSASVEPAGCVVHAELDGRGDPSDFGEAFSRLNRSHVPSQHRG